MKGRVRVNRSFGTNRRFGMRVVSSVFYMRLAMAVRGLSLVDCFPPGGGDGGNANVGPESDSDLQKLIEDAIPLAPLERADLLYNSQALESAHQSAASQGQSHAPEAEDDVDLHFVCFVKDQKNDLWELDGRRKGPLNRGHLTQDEDVLSEKALDLGPRKFLARELENGELRFSLITLAPSFG